MTNQTNTLRKIAYTLGTIGMTLLFFVVPILAGENNISIWIIAIIMIIVMMVAALLVRLMEAMLDRADRIDHHRYMAKRDRHNRRLNFSRDYDIPLD